jgi:hydroxyacylglutathione hydrolase
MTHVVTRPTAPFATKSGRLTVHQLPAATDNLVWVIEAPSGEAAAVDGPDAGGVLDFCAARGLRLTTILNTHTHHDHIGINRDLERRGLLESVKVYGPKRAAADVPGLTVAVDEGDAFELSGVPVRVLLTEGHINGHVSFCVEDTLFCGDTMFGAGCGYLFDGPPAKMHTSLTRLAALPPDTRVCCAHEYTQDNLRFAYSVEPGNAALSERIRTTWALRGRGECSVPSTVELERRTNPFLRHDSAELVASVTRQMPDSDLSTPGAIFAATRALKDKKAYKQITDAELPTS